MISGRIVVATLAAGAGVGLAPWALTRVLSAGRLFTKVDAIPQHDVALVLGAQVFRDGTPSSYLRGRLDQAVLLFHAGIVKAILVSGDHGQPDYNEPDAMRDYLIRHGIPADKVVADYAGFDTYDSCVRARDVFGVHEVIVVSQSYHLPRAVATCRLIGVDAVGVGDAERTRNLQLAIYQFREVLADIKMIWDVTSRRRPTLGPYEPALDAARISVP